MNSNINASPNINVFNLIESVIQTDRMAREEIGMNIMYGLDNYLNSPEMLKKVLIDSLELKSNNQDKIIKNIEEMINDNKMILDERYSETIKTNLNKCSKKMDIIYTKLDKNPNTPLIASLKILIDCFKENQRKLSKIFSSKRIQDYSLVTNICDKKIYFEFFFINFDPEKKYLPVPTPKQLITITYIRCVLLFEEYCESDNTILTKDHVDMIKEYLKYQ
jgi:uncharacterized coiled-coil protein SlyX